MRSVVFTSAVVSILIFASYAAGHLSEAIIRIHKLEVGQSIYLLSVEDRERRLHIIFAGTRCFPGPPKWNEPHMAPLPNYARFFVERGIDSLEKVPRCPPLNKMPPPDHIVEIHPLGH